MPFHLTHHLSPRPLYSRSWPHERRNMRSVWPNGTVREFRWQGRQTGTHAVSVNIPAEDIGEWVHLVGTYDGVNWNLYKNGELLASRADTVGCVPLTTNWYIGSSNGNARFFDGEIRDVSIWDSALNAAQAAAVYAGTAPSEDYATSVTAYTYDALNRLTSLTDPVGNTTSYTYDYRGLVLTETNEKNATRHYTYDTLGRLISKTDRNDRVTTYAYDSVGRLTAEHWGDTSDYFMYTYDLVGNLLYATDGDHSYSYTYDTLYRPIYTSFNFDSQSAVFTYTYDAVGRQTSSALTLNGHASRVNTTTYDYLGNATSIRQHGNAVDEIFAEFEHNANGLLTSVRRYEKDDDTINEIAESLYEYNSNNAVTSITHNNAIGSQIVKHSYTYDETNNIVEYLNSIDGNTEYNYDFLGQLISADHASQTDESYAYDSNGNRVVANGDAYTTGTNNELTSDGDYAYTYDAEGNRTSRTNSAGTERELYTWDYRNRLTQVIQQTFNTETQTWQTIQVVEYAYDYNNVWIRKVVGDSKTIFIPENYQTTVQIDNGITTHHYLWTPNAQDKLLADTTTDGVLWSLTDHLGTIRDILGTASTHLIYDAFGNLISGTNPLLFGYTGKAFDTDTQLQNNINRWYDATIGRWLSTDPIGFNGNDTNLYRYVGNSISNQDAWGLIEDKSRADMLFITAPDDEVRELIRERYRKAYRLLNEIAEKLRSDDERVLLCFHTWYPLSQINYICSEIDKLIMGLEEGLLFSIRYKENTDIKWGVPKRQQGGLRIIYGNTAFTGDGIHDIEYSLIHEFTHLYLSFRDHMYYNPSKDKYYTRGRERIEGLVTGGRRNNETYWGDSITIELLEENADTFERFVKCVFGFDKEFEIPVIDVEWW